MGELRFPFPDAIHEAVDMLNESSEHYNLTVMQGQGALYVFDGDQTMLITHELQEVKIFVAGLFLGTFHGRDIGAIRTELEQLNTPYGDQLKEMRADLDDLRARLARYGNLELVE